MARMPDRPREAIFDLLEQLLTDVREFERSEGEDGSITIQDESEDDAANEWPWPRQP